MFRTFIFYPFLYLQTPCYGYGYLSAIDSLDADNNEDSNSGEQQQQQQQGGAGPDVQTLQEGVMELTDMGLSAKISTVFEDCSTQIDEEHLFKGSYQYLSRFICQFF